jgi:protein-disulfide isomerase
VLAALGLVIGTYLAILHYQAGADGTIDSPFCGVGTVINCNTVLGSTYARLFGLPVAVWAAVTYAAVLLISFVGHTGLLVLLCGWTFAFSLYMASLSLFVIKSACLFCLTLYAVNTGLFLSAVVLARSSALLTGGQTAYSTVGYAVLVAGLWWWQAQAVATVAPTTPVVAPTPATINTEFLRYYNSRPQVTLRGAERHTRGPTQALLTISEFVDFRCPTCAHARVVFKQLLDGNPNEVRLIFRHYPLDQECNPALSHQVHPTSCAAAVAAECAGEQGKFWEYADLLFAEQQKAYTRQDLEIYATTLDLDTSRFTACLTDGQMKDLVRQDLEEAERIGIKATPTLVINGRLVEGLPTAQKLASLITAEKQRAKK